MDSERSLQVKLQSRVKDRSRGTGFGSGAARRGLLWGVSKENVSLDQPRSSPLASAFDATAEIFTSFDLVFR